MARMKPRDFGTVVRERRRQLDLTQEEVARRIKTSTPYIGHLESGKRHPSGKVIGRLAQVLQLGERDLYLLANPAAMRLLGPKAINHGKSAWDEFRQDVRLHRALRIERDEMNLLAKVAAMGHAAHARDFVYILNTIRYALGRS